MAEKKWSELIKQYHTGKMAEKEERILITRCSSWCHARRMSCDPFDDKDGMYCDKTGKWVRITEKDCAKCKDPVLLGISRQEAINLMADAISDAAKRSCDKKFVAEAALNALLNP